MDRHPCSTRMAECSRLHALGSHGSRATMMRRPSSESPEDARPKTPRGRVTSATAPATAATTERRHLNTTKPSPPGNLPGEAEPSTPGAPCSSFCSSLPTRTRSPSAPHQRRKAPHTTSERLQGMGPQAAASHRDTRTGSVIHGRAVCSSTHPHTGFELRMLTPPSASSTRHTWAPCQRAQALLAAPMATLPSGPGAPNFVRTERPHEV